MNDNTKQILQWAQELQALSTAGLFYTKDRFDYERFQRIQEMAAEMSSLVTDTPLEEIKGLFQQENVYQTPKMDTRAIIFNEKDEVLLIQELDGTWAPPGGWCEYNLYPAANAIKEAKEEAGLDVDAYRLVAVHDQHIHNQPYQFFYVERFFYLCRVLGGSFQENIETLASGWFSLDNLPKLHPQKIAKEQLQLCLEAKYADVWETRFDHGMPKKLE
jgi:ADP-ribose pyrophosphatase YjhB (NUDIX family)